MEYLRRKCVCCRTLSPLSCYTGKLKTCILCLEKAKVKYIENKEIVLRRCKGNRSTNIEKEKERHRLYDLTTKVVVNEKKREYTNLDYYCPVCLYNVKLYRKHCKSVVHLSNLKYCDEQKQISILNSHIEHHFYIMMLMKRLNK